jgi:glycosyltransferase involved in cell wall biosynthesis
VIGYYGALARWFDYNLLKSVACLRPDLSFVLIGPYYDSTLKSSSLLELPNLFYLGVKPYAQIPAYLRCFDVAMIPFQLNDITHATSPLKLFEYMAGGKPVVVTPMRESLRYPGVLSGKDPAEFAAQLDLALQLRNDSKYIAALDEVARQNTWDARARQLLQALDPGSI